MSALGRSTFRGTYAARGVVISHAHLGEACARERVLAFWEPGTRAVALVSGWAVLWPRERWLESRASPGALVVASGEGWSTAPEGSGADRAREIRTRWRGELACVADAPEIDPADWLEVGALEVHELYAPPPVLANPTVVAAPIRASAREILGDVAVGSAPAAEEIRARIGPGASSPARGNGLIGRLLTWLGGREASPEGGDRARDRDRSGGGARTAVPAPPIARSPLRETLSRIAARALSGVHARHLRRLRQMFESGDLESALRNALPLRGAEAERLSLALGWPAPRDALRFTDGRGGGGVSASEDEFSALERLYRAAVERLVAARRIEEAAFVLGELLDQAKEAVALLERHGRLRAAAELAELRALEAGLVVRQWFLAGDVDRAVAIARRSGAFADAVLRLERTDVDRAKALRLHWADTLAKAGDFATAVDVAWPVEQARPLARDWIARGIELGGEAGARMLVRRALLEPEVARDVQQRAFELIDDRRAERAIERGALVAELLRPEHRASRMLPGSLRPIAQRAARAMMRDWCAGVGGLQRERCAELADLSGDLVLRADLPAFPRHRPRTSPEQREIYVAPSDAGTVAVHDLAPAPKGRLWLALGEAGLRLAARDGRTIRHFDVPAYRLVVADATSRVIALAPRGTCLCASRIDLGTQRAASWIDLADGAFASTFDGQLWFRSDGRAAYGLDAIADRERALWHATDFPGPVRLVARSHARPGLHLLGGEPATELWSYRADLTLERRVEVEDFAARSTECWDGMCDRVAADVGPSGELLWVDGAAAEGELLVRLRSRSGEFSLALAGDAVLQRPILSARWGVVTLRSSGHATVYVIDHDRRAGWMQIQLTAVPDARVHLADSTLYAADTLGRIFVVDLERGALAHRLRS